VDDIVGLLKRVRVHTTAAGDPTKRGAHPLLKQVVGALTLNAVASKESLSRDVILEHRTRFFGGPVLVNMKNLATRRSEP